MRYQKPQIKTRKIKLNFFLSSRSRDSLAFPLIGPVFAQSGGPTPPGGGGNCSCSGGCACNSNNCFLKGTMILLSGGKSKPIEEINEGDLVVSYDIETGNISERKVEEFIVHDDNKDGYLLVNNLLKVTGYHPIYANEEWNEASNLKVGDSLLDPQGNNIIVDKIEHIPGAVNLVYNLHLEGPEHNYFADGILVHNKTSGSVCNGLCNSDGGNCSCGSQCAACEQCSGGGTCAACEACS